MDFDSLNTWMVDFFLDDENLGKSDPVGIHLFEICFSPDVTMPLSHIQQKSPGKDISTTCKINFATPWKSDYIN